MSKTPRKGKDQRMVKRVTARPPLQSEFDEVVGLIEAARARAFVAVNTELVNLYWQIGEYISRKLESAAWGEAVVEHLAAHIARNHPDLRGFTRPNLFRMRQFYETYKNDKKSHRWCDNCRGPTTSSFSAVPSGWKNASFTCRWLCGNAGVSGSWSGN